MSTTTKTRTVSDERKMTRERKQLLGRLAGCLGLGFVLALMVGNQEGTQNDFGYAFRQAVFGPRLILFLAIGVVIFLAITFWPRIVPYLQRPGIRPLAFGGLAVVASYALLNWSDSGRLDNGKLATLARAARDTGGLDPLTRLFYGQSVHGFYWLLLLVAFVLVAAGLIRRDPRFAWAGAGLSVVVAIWGLVSQAIVAGYLGIPDHSTGAQVALLGYLAMAAAAVLVVRSQREAADTAGFMERVFSWRPGFPLAVLAAITGLIGVLLAAWFSPQNKSVTLLGMAGFFSGSGINALTQQFLLWIGYVVFVVVVAIALAATYRRDERLAWASIGLGALGILLTLLAMQNFTAVAAKSGFDGATGSFENTGTGGWMLCASLTLAAGAGVVLIRQQARHRKERAAKAEGDVVLATSGAPEAGSKNFNQALVWIVIAGALFYPPMANPFWQSVLVSEIGIYVLLAIGLNVVVGWAGLLDLGFIAFYAIGSYTTAYLVGALPIQPPDWLHLSPLLAIPFAIVICLAAGVMLGAPTLRLRGDYLAIVTLGFGEIIRIAAINNPGNLTNGPRGAFGIPHPVIHIGPLHLVWGQGSLPYWYLLLVLTAVTILLFNRLEHSRLGRAWAAIREDEVAAQATGINTVRVKLLAFAIGASTSGVAGVFFASQVGFISPNNFLLNNSILVVAYVVFGGMGSLAGAIAGAATLTWLPEFLKDQVPAEDRQMWIGAILLAMMVFRPAGLVPARRRAAELSGLEKAPSSEVAAVPASEGM